MGCRGKCSERYISIVESVNAVEIEVGRSGDWRDGGIVKFEIVIEEIFNCDESSIVIVSCVCHSSLRAIYSFSVLFNAAPLFSSYSDYDHFYFFFQYSEEDIPEARFSYDLSPMAVMIKKKGKHWYEFITTMCALIGGTFTVLGLLSSFLNSIFKSKRI